MGQGWTDRCHLAFRVLDAPVNLGCMYRLVSTMGSLVGSEVHRRSGEKYEAVGDD
jgi:hypothetical protein